MAFWGAFVTREQPFTISHDGGPAPPRRLRISHATLAEKTGCRLFKNRSVVRCQVGKKDPVHVCSLRINHLECCQLDLEFHESEDVTFSVYGPRGVHLAGYYLDDPPPIPHSICLPHIDNDMALVSRQWVNSSRRSNEVPSREETFKSAEAGGQLERNFENQHAKEDNTQRIEYVQQRQRMEGKPKRSEDATIGGQIQQHASVEADCVNEDEAQQAIDIDLEDQNAKSNFDKAKSGNLFEDQVQTKGGKIHEKQSAEVLCGFEGFKSREMEKLKLKHRKKKRSQEGMIADYDPTGDQIQSKTDNCCRDPEVDQYSRPDDKCGSSQDILLKTGEPMLDTEVKEMMAAEVEGLDVSLVSEENMSSQYQDCCEDVLVSSILPDAEPKKGKKKKEKVKGVDPHMEDENGRARKRDKHGHNVKSHSAALVAGQKEVKVVTVCADDENNRHDSDSSYKEAKEKLSVEPSFQHAKTVSNSNSQVLVLALPGNLDSTRWGKEPVK